VSVNSVNGFSSQVALSLSMMPSDVHAVFSIPTGEPDFGSTLTITVPADAVVGSYTFTVTGVQVTVSGGGITHSTKALLQITYGVINTVGTTSTTPPPPATASSCNLPGCFNSLQVLLLAIIAVVAAALALRCRQKTKPTRPAGAPAGESRTAFCTGCGGRLPNHYSPCPINDGAAKGQATE
jgi:hypothetical protein